MGELLIQGGTPLAGETRIQGAKNSILPILAAAILTEDVVELPGCPRLRDVTSSVQILQALGCAVRWRGETLEVDSRGLDRYTISDRLMREMRSSSVYLGPLLARCGAAELSYPGGCELGPRPIDLHLAGLRELGAEIRESGGMLHCQAAKLHGCELVLAIPSVGATENLMLAACGAEGTTVISNAAREPEIEDLQDFLTACGAEIRGAGTSTITVRGGRKLHGCSYRCMPDRIVTATYLCAAAAAGGLIFLRGAREEQLATVTAVLRQAGCEICADEAGIACRREERLHSVHPVRTGPYPGFPTDAQAVVMAALCGSCGTTVFEENIFENRYRHVDELCRMGARIRVSGRTAVVAGVHRLSGAAVRCTDLRGGAALCVAGLGACGETRVSAITHIDRGYENIVRDLTELGARISRI